MAEIVQLVENGEKKYLKTHVDAVEGLEVMLKQKVTITSDSLINIKTAAPTEGDVKILSKNGVKMISGSVTMKTPRGQWREIAKLPDWARPSVDLKLIGVPSVNTTAMPEQHSATIQLNTVGQLMVMSWNSDVIMYDFSSSYI